MSGFFKEINKTAIIIATVAVIILGLSIVIYGYMNISYKNKVFEAEQAEKHRKEKEAELWRAEQLANLNACMGDSRNNYFETWNKSCRNRGLPNDCSLPASLAELYQNQLKEDESRCVKIFSEVFE